MKIGFPRIIGPRTIAPIIVGIVASATVATSIHAYVAQSTTDALRQQIEAKELAIYAGRGKGMLDFYINNASQNYLGWPPVAKTPMTLGDLRTNSAAMRGKTQEKIDTSFKGFTVSGNTAVIYYTNHRTMTDDGKPVNQYFENIHVWANEGGQWRVIGGLSRLMPDTFKPE